MTMTPDEMKDARALVARARELASKATKGEWSCLLGQYSFGHNGRFIINASTDNASEVIFVAEMPYSSTTGQGIQDRIGNGKFIAQSRQLVPDLAAALERVLDENEEVRRAERAKWLPLWEVNMKLVAAIENGGASPKQVEKILTQIYVAMQGLHVQLAEEAEAPGQGQGQQEGGEVK